jgi:hypothetical protein
MSTDFARAALTPALSQRVREKVWLPPPLGEGWGEGPWASAAAYLLPQHRSIPTFVSLLSTPFIGLSVIRVTPVSV